MAVQPEQMKVVAEKLKAFTAELRKINQESRSSDPVTDSYARELLGRWIDRIARFVADHLSAYEVSNFRSMQTSSNSIFRLEIDRYIGYMAALMISFALHPEDVLAAPRSSSPTAPAPAVSEQAANAPKKVFIVHGSDDANTQRLQSLLKDRWGLEVVVLSKIPGRGRFLLEMLGDESSKASYAFVLFTPDDLVKGPAEPYYQARPNAFLELGLFVGSWGRERVCIVRQENSKLPTDLDGLKRVDFKDSVEEKFLDIERELEAAGLVQPHQ